MHALGNAWTATSLSFPETHFIKGLWVQGPNLVKIVFTLTWKWIIKSGHNFVFSLAVVAGANLWPEWAIRIKMRTKIVLITFPSWASKSFVKWPPGISACLPASDIVPRCSLMSLCLLKACTWYEDIHIPGRNDGKSAMVLKAMIVLNTWLKVGMHVHDFDI